jgi:uroporphyrinogen-III synthase
MKILVTRPLTTAYTLAEKIALLGFTPVVFPAVEIKFLSCAPDLTGIEMLVFTSSTAVDAFSQHIHAISPAIALFAPGKDTAQALARAGFGEAVYPEFLASASSLLQLPRLQAVQGRNIMVSKGKGGNPLLVETLKARGAYVSEAILYERECPQVEKLPDLQEIDWVICTSEASLKNLVELFGEAMKTQKFLVSSERMQAALKAEGIKTIPLLAKQATDEALLAALGAMTRTEDK